MEFILASASPRRRELQYFQILMEGFSEFVRRRHCVFYFKRRVPVYFLLKVAAMLHDCGMRVKYYNHQRHSWYMILNSTLYGVSHREIVLAAFTACCHKTASAAGRISALSAESPLIFFFLSKSSTFIMS